MRVLLAPDKFRGTFTAAQVCELLARGIRERDPAMEIDPLPLADGGEGTLESLLRARGGTLVELEVAGPIAGERVAAVYGVTPQGDAIVEAARFCGLELTPPARRDPSRTSSWPLGEGIAAALDAGLRSFLIGLGGTATVEGGAGMARALGYRLLDPGGRPIDESDGRMERCAAIDASMAHPGIGASRFTALCDVANPLLGPRGAAAVYGPQKGATQEQIVSLERRLRSLAGALARWRGTGAGHLGTMEGGGAAGGLGLGCLAFLGAELRPGARYLMEACGFAARLRRADLVVTGEGSFDAQSLEGKVAGAVLEAAATEGRPVMVVTGRWDGTRRGTWGSSIQILCPQQLDERPDALDEDGMIELGRRIGSLANPGGQ